MKKIKNYDISADIIKIIAAFLVVLSHATDRFVIYAPFKYSLSWDVVYYFSTLSRVAVPLFVMLSGYFLLHKEKVENLGNFYTRRLSRILPPLVFWIIIYTGNDIDWKITRLTTQYLQQRLWDGGGLWHLYFLIVILELYLIAPLLIWFVEKLNQRNKTVFFFLLLGFGIFCSFLNIYGIDFKKYSLTMFIPYIGIFYAGGYLKTVKTPIKFIPFLLMMYFLLPIITNKIGDGVLGAFIVLNYSPTVLLMSIGLFLTIKNIDKFFEKFLKLNFVRKIITFSASLSFGIYIIHVIILDKVFSVLHLYPWQIHTPLVFFAILPAILTFIISFLIIAVIRRFPYGKYIVG